MFFSLKNAISSFFKSLYRSKKISIYVIFLLSSFGFWFLTMLSKTHETTFNIPIQYINYPIDLVEGVNPPNLIQVRVKAAGISILSFYLFNNSSIILDYERANSQPTRNGKKLFWIMNSKREEIANILSSSIEIMNVKPERIVALFLNKMKKEVTVRLKSEIHLKPSYWLERDVKITPNTVVLYGDENLLDSISSITTSLLEVQDLDKDQVFETSLIFPNGLKSKTNFVLIELNVEPFIEETITKEVEIRNLSKIYSIKLFPKKVNVTLRLSKDKYHLLKTNSLGPFYVDASDLSEKTLFVRHDKFPQGIKLKRIFPNRLEFFLIKE